MLIRVTQEHIDKGALREYPRCGNCPVALAIRQAGFTLALTTYTYVSIDGAQKKIGLPAFVQQNILSFDLGKPVEPFEFNLDLEAV